MEKLFLFLADGFEEIEALGLDNIARNYRPSRPIWRTIETLVRLLYSPAYCNRSAPIRSFRRDFLVAVSYTHLDVYKRQVSPSPRR